MEYQQQENTSRKFWKGRSVFVTGATGMVGSWLVKKLVEMQANVVALVRDLDPQSEVYRSGSFKDMAVVHGSLEDFWSLERAISEYGVSCVFHLGAQSIVKVANVSPLQTLEANVRGTYNLLEACRIHMSTVKYVVIASSDKAYGEKSDLPYVESMSLSGRYPYEVSKSCADLIAQSYYSTYGLSVVIARCGNIYGGGDLHWNRIVPGTIRSLIFKERPVVRSDGTYVRDYLYVKDAVSAYMTLAENLDDGKVKGGAFNFSAEQPLNVLSLVDLIRRIMGSEDVKPIVENKATCEIRDQYLSSKKARNLLNWSIQFNHHQGLQETIQWYRDFFLPNSTK